GLACVVLVLRLVDLLHRPGRPRLGRLRQRRQDIRGLVEPAALLLRRREHVPDRSPEAERAVADGQDRVGHAAAVVDPRLTHRHGPGSRGHLPFAVVTVAYHQPVPALVALVRMLLDVSSDLDLQRCGEHLPRAVAYDLIQQRATRQPGVAAGADLTGAIGYRGHEAFLPEPARQRRLLINTVCLADHPRGGT